MVEAKKLFMGVSSKSAAKNSSMEVFSKANSYVDIDSDVEMMEELFKESLPGPSMPRDPSAPPKGPGTPPGPGTTSTGDYLADLEKYENSRMAAFNSASPPPPKKATTEAPFLKAVFQGAPKPKGDTADTKVDSYCLAGLLRNTV